MNEDIRSKSPCEDASNRRSVASQTNILLHTKDSLEMKKVVKVAGMICKKNSRELESQQHPWWRWSEVSVDEDVVVELYEDTWMPLAE